MVIVMGMPFSSPGAKVKLLTGPTYRFKLWLEANWSGLRIIAGLPLSSGLAVKSLTMVWSVALAEVTLVTVIVTTWVCPGLIVKSVRTGDRRKPLPPELVAALANGVALSKTSN